MEGTSAPFDSRKLCHQLAILKRTVKRPHIKDSDRISLPEHQARAVELRYFEGLSVNETAEKMQRSPAAVNALVARGLGALGRKPQN